MRLLRATCRCGAAPDGSTWPWSETTLAEDVDLRCPACSHSETWSLVINDGDVYVTLPWPPTTSQARIEQMRAGGVYVDVEGEASDEDPPCSCSERACKAAPAPCKGECGCDGCRLAYVDFLSSRDE